jgi:CRP-like cAMP-binding protein
MGPLLKGTIYALATALFVVAVAIAKALFGHWWLARGMAKPLGDSGARGVKTPALQGDIPTVLRRVALFKTLADDDVAALARVIQPVQIDKKQDVFREDDPGDAFFVVLEGELEILKRRAGSSDRSETIGWLGPGDGFGEIALLEGTVRTVTVRASRPSRLLRLAKANFDRMVVGRIGTAHVREVLQHAVFLGRLVFLAGWPFDDLVRYARRCGNVRFHAGVQVLRRGDTNLWFYLIYDGVFEARDGERVLRRMQPGDYFGEISLLENGVATATVVAIEEGRCLTMGRADFQEFFAKDFRIGLRMEALAAKRLGSRLFLSR